MELGVFVVAFVVIAGIGLLVFGRVPFPVRKSRHPDRPVADAAATAEPPGHADDSG